MTTINYKIQFHSFWHTGSGLAGGVVADREVLKTREGLPFIPGKNLKGLLADAAITLQELNDSFISTTFIEEVFHPKDNSLGTQCHFTNAYLSKAIIDHFSKNGPDRQLLYQNIASTAIDDNGQTVKSSLREMEATIPLVLYAQIIDFPINETFREQLVHCMKFIKRMGTKRHRGFGRCDWSIIK